LDCSLVKKSYPSCVCNESDQNSCPHESSSSDSSFSSGGRPSSAVQVNMEMLILIFALLIALFI